VSAALIILFTIQDNYFFSRLNFINGEANLSSMIWISGWERAWLELKNSYGLGVGFQQLGYSDIKGAYMDNIIRLFGKPFNLYDGGSLAPKIIAEFGLLGIIVIFSYLVLFFHLVYKMRNIAKLNRGLKRDEIFFCFYSSLIVSFSLELFVRGVGYFSSGVTFFTLGFMLYLKKVII
jgi:hypothetical protein